MKNFLQKGDSVEYANTGSAISSGDVVVMSDLIGVAVTNIAATSGVGTVNLSGVYSLAKTTGQTYSIGDKLFWDTGNSKVTSTATGFKMIGHVMAAAASGDTSCSVRLASQGTDARAAVVSGLTNNLTGTVDGAIDDVPNIALSTSDTYTDAAVNTAVNAAIAETNEQLKELAAKVNDTLVKLQQGGVMASS